MFILIVLKTIKITNPKFDSTEEIILESIKQLWSTLKNNNTSVPDTKTRALAVTDICQLPISKIDESLLKQIEYFLVRSHAYQSAEIIEDDFDVDLSSLDIDYCGGYTFVPHEQLPEVLQQERVYYEKLLQFYLKNYEKLTVEDKTIEHVCMPHRTYADSKLTELNLHNCTLYNSTFTNMELDDLFCYECCLDKVVFKNCSFDYVRFSDCSLKGAKFIDVRFEGGELDAPLLEGAEFLNCSFEEVVFLKFTPAHLDFKSCDFSRCFFSFCDLRNVLGLTNIENSFGSSKVKLPSDSDHAFVLA